MAAVNRAYTREYEYVSPSEYAAMSYPGTSYQAPNSTSSAVKESPERAPKREHSRRVRVQKEKIERNISSKNAMTAPKALISQGELFRTILVMVVIGMILVSIVWMGAKATEIKYSINQLDAANQSLENDIALLNVKIEGSNSIESVEEYATTKLKMKYPSSSECIYIKEGAKVEIDLVKTIKEKAYN